MKLERRFLGTRELLAHAIRDEKEKIGLTNQQIADQTATDLDFINRLERGIYVPPQISDVNRVLAILGIDASALPPPDPEWDPYDTSSVN